MSETTRVLPEILLALSSAGATVWRQNVGTGWVGEVHRVSQRGPVMLNPGDVVIRAARPLHAGLCAGSSDIIGIDPQVIGAEHVGQTWGRFLAVEGKSSRGRASSEQQQFIDHIQKHGGISGIARSGAEALALLDTFRAGHKTPT